MSSYLYFYEMNTYNALVKTTLSGFEDADYSFKNNGTVFVSFVSERIMDEHPQISSEKEVEREILRQLVMKIVQ
jgi:hypothetical protein